MPTLAPVQPNPSVLLWARQESGYDVERVAVKTVLDALSSNRIGPEVAARHLSLKYEHFDKLKGALIVQPGMALLAASSMR